MHDLVTQLAANVPYLAIVLVILLGGVGLPVPEDVPLVVSGYLSGQGHVNPWTMLPVVLAAVLCTDALTMVLGRRYGRHVPRLPLLRRVLTATRLARAEAIITDHGGKFIFVTRFLPGLRSPVIFAAGGLGMPFRRFVLYDGTAALLGVPLIFGVAFVFSHEIDLVRRRVAEGQLAAILLVAAIVLVYVLVNVATGRRLVARTDGTLGEHAA